LADLKSHAIEAGTVKVTQGIGVSVAIYGGYTAQEWGVIAGIVIGLLSLVIQAVLTFYFKNETLKLEMLRLENESSRKEH